MGLRRNFHNEGFASRVESVQKMSIATIELIGVPGRHFDSIGLGTINQLKCDLRFGFESNFVRNFGFFRRIGSAHNFPLHILSINLRF